MTITWLVATSITVSMLVLLGVYMFDKNNKIDFKEFAAGFVLSAIISFAIPYAGLYTAVTHTETWNGEVVKKYQDTVSCEHSYEVCTGSGDKRKCTTKYEHWNDYDWVVETTAGNVIIDRVDRQGKREPQRWSKVRIGETASVSHSYSNYLKGTNNQYFSKNNVTMPYTVPVYPRPFDYYRMNRVVQTGIKVDTSRVIEINTMLNAMLKKNGSKYQVNPIVILSGHPINSAAYIKNQWEGGEKNDVLIFVGVDKDFNIKWSEVYSFSEDLTFNSTLKSRIMDINGVYKVADSYRFTTAIEETLPMYKRMSMSKFESYKYHYAFSGWQVLFVLFCNILLIGIYLWYAKRTEIFGSRS